MIALYIYLIGVLIGIFICLRETYKRGCATYRDLLWILSWPFLSWLFVLIIICIRLQEKIEDIDWNTKIWEKKDKPQEWDGK